MDKNGKLLGKLNIIDLLALLVVIVLVGGGFYRFYGKMAAETSTPATIEYVMEVNNIRQFTVDALQRKGDIFTQKTKLNGGTIINVESVPYVQAATMPNGTVVKAEVPDRYTAYVTVRTEGRSGERVYLDSSNTEIYVGGNLAWDTKWVQLSECSVKSLQVIK
ncbi:hypothetical protein CS063_06195 [Sporanaerobium hydrogeniformans]|uniref:Uncharacterized protein n=1 Tax=Sporanaerobium hydrogeniformans TaxID=3072179 RepID=A0AC61DEQ1_9FIRM|nr:DUF4330 domain-containing protein [Sporanaerobium hydrogeniformans]PHV71278.1 hypothetical protein CS063_06195 [Sporanaerobium hydrogeniformans]